MSFLSDVGDFLGSNVGSFASGLLDTGLSFLGDKSLAQDARAFSKLQAQNQMQWRVADLKKAGLNPMLAVMGGGGLGGASTPGVSVPSFKSDIGGSAARFAESKLLAAQTGKVESERLLNEALARNADASAGASVAAAEVSRKMIPKLEAEIELIYTQRGKTSAEYNLVQIETELKKLNAEQLKAILPDLVKMVRNDAYRSDLGLPGSENMSDVEKTFWGKIAAFVRSMLGGGAGTSAAALIQALK